MEILRYPDIACSGNPEMLQRYPLVTLHFFSSPGYLALFIFPCCALPSPADVHVVTGNMDIFRFRAAEQN